jgi:hypothetical protein
MLSVKVSKLRIFALSLTVASLVAGAGLIFMGILQQNAVPLSLKAQVWADGWKSDEEYIEDSARKGHFFDIVSDPMRQLVDAPHSSLIATKKLVGGGMALLSVGSGLLAWYIAGPRTA